MKLTENQRNYLVQQIAENTNEYPSGDRTYFEADKITLLWSSDDEAYFVLKPDMTWTYVTSNDLESAINELSDKALLQWLENEECIETEEEFEDYFSVLDVEV